MPAFDVVTIVPLPRHVYAALAFTPALDALALADVGTLEEHAPGAPRTAAIAMRLAQTHAACAAAAAAWRAHARVPELQLAHVLAPLITGQVGVGVGVGARASARAQRCFRVTLQSRLIDMLRWVLAAFSSGADAGVHYDAVQLRDAACAGEPPCVRFLIGAEALPALAIEGCVRFEDTGTPGATQQRVLLHVSTGSDLLDAAIAPFIDSFVRPDLERMGEAACRLVAALSAPGGGAEHPGPADGGAMMQAQ